MGWPWCRTHRVAPVRADRHGQVLVVATPWMLVHGTRVEEAHLRGRVRRPPPEPVVPQLHLGARLIAAPAGTGPAHRVTQAPPKYVGWGFASP